MACRNLRLVALFVSVAYEDDVSSVRRAGAREYILLSQAALTEHIQRCVQLIGSDKLLYMGHDKLLIYQIPELQVCPVADPASPPARFQSLPGANVLYSYQYSARETLCYGGHSILHSLQPGFGRVIFCTTRNCLELLIPEGRVEESTVFGPLCTMYGWPGPVMSVGLKRAFALTGEGFALLRFSLDSSDIDSMGLMYDPTAQPERPVELPVMEEISGRILVHTDRSVAVLDTALYNRIFSRSIG